MKMNLYVICGFVLIIKCIGVSRMLNLNEGYKLKVKICKKGCLWLWIKGVNSLFNFIFFLRNVWFVCLFIVEFIIWLMFGKVLFVCIYNLRAWFLFL